jgi:sulfur dioxygenase
MSSSRVVFGRLFRALVDVNSSKALIGCCRPQLVTSRWYTVKVAPAPDYVFRPLLDYRTNTYTFLLADAETREAVIIDPVYEQAERDVSLVKELNLNLIYGINTHMHADHVTGTGKIRRMIPTFKSVIAKYTQAKADRYIEDGELIKFGKFTLECRSTPGHTDGCMTYVWHEKGMAFTGDALLIRKCGRTDFQQGSPEKLYKVVHEKIFSLPDHFLLYPGHDYVGFMVTTVGEEKKWNARLTKPLGEFVEIMNNLNLPYPKFIDEAIPGNLVDGEIEPEKAAVKAT